MPQVKRESGRAQAAEFSRKTIASAARRLFQERGYTESTMESIAAESGFAVQTVYFHFKSKAAIVTRLIDEVLAEQVAPRYQLAMTSNSPAEVIRLFAAIAHESWENGWDVVRTLGVAAKSDPGLAGRLSQWEGGYLFGMTNLVRRLGELGALRPELEDSTAVDIGWTLTSPDVYRLLRVERGWDGDAYEHWLARVLTRELLGARSRTKPARVAVRGRR
jgi:AcrR family transcriptional regulator